ncbi:MAG TPA: hypothetical protein VIK27_08655 [Candidatus Aquilonibacter sp.]
MCAQGPTATTRHLDYAFQAYPAVGNGGGTGTLHVDILGTRPMADCSCAASTTGARRGRKNDRGRRWNAKSTTAGSVSCSQPPYGLSPSQRALFPMLAAGFLRAASSGTRAYTVKDALGVNVLAAQQLGKAASTNAQTVDVTFSGRTTVPAYGRVWYGTDHGSVTYDPSLGARRYLRDNPRARRQRVFAGRRQLASPRQGAVRR